MKKTRILQFIVVLLIGSSACAQITDISTDTDLGTGAFEGEPYLAINPLNPQNIVVAWMHVSSSRSIRVRSSFNGGQTWSTPYDVPHFWINEGDPTMAFDNSGNLFLCFIDHKNAIPDTGAVYSFKSTDGGLTWGNRAEVINMAADSGSHQPVDRPWLVCDRSSGSLQGTLYVTTKPASGTPAPYHPYFIKSTDGAQTWQPFRYVDSTGWLSALPTPLAVPVVSSNGTFYCIYPSYLPSQNPLPRYLMASSANGGTSFNYSVVMNNTSPVVNDSAKLGWQLIANPSNANHLAFFNIKATYGDADVFMTETYNAGITWSTPIRINDDVLGNDKMQDLVWASFDSDSDLVVCWRDRRNGAGVGYAASSQIFGAVRWKDSINFSPNFIISDTLVAYNNILLQGGNDFLSQRVQNDTLYIVWGDTRTGFLNIWFDKIALVNNISNGIINIAHDKLPFIEIYPNPANGIVQVNTNNQKNVSIELRSLRGELIREYSTNSFSVSNLENGVYFVIVKTDKQISTRKLVKQ